MNQTTSEHRFNQIATFLSEKAANLANQAIAHRVLFEGNAGNRNYNQKDRSQRRDGVKGYCRAAAQGIVGDVTRDSGFQDFPRL